MKNRIIRNVDAVLSFILMVIMLFLWILLVYVGIASFVLARIASNICAKSLNRISKICDIYEYAKENLDCMNRRIRDEGGETFKELLTKMFKVEA